MPICLDCRKFIDHNCSAYIQASQILGREIPPPPLGGCEIPIVENYLPFIQEGMKVLEIGCGSWSLIKDYCQTVGASYEGIDSLVEYFGKKTVATRIENLADLSFPNDFFDLVIGNQTMEHWAENGCTLKWGLFQCFRTCKYSGRVLMNVPIHFHGTREFILGDLEKIRSLLTPFSASVAIENWGYPYAPIPSLFPHPGYWKLHKKPAYVLDIQAIKDRPLPQGYSNRGASYGRLAQLFNYPPSYNIYRILRRIGLFTQDYAFSAPIKAEITRKSGKSNINSLI
ncbi:hypothetical protein H6G64_19620 [Calothrix sp. FACHB-156]|nr:hypothetical protein [Calothrix sp. FACHB-156]